MIKKYGISKKESWDDDPHVKSIIENGFTVLKNQISIDDIELLKRSSEEIYNEQIESFGKERLKVIGELDMVRAPFLSNNLFDQLILNEQIERILKSILGEKYILHLQNVIINRSRNSHHQSAWHRDIPYQNYTLSQPISLSVFYALSPFTTETGGTKLLPKSHHLESFPEDDFVEVNFQQPLLNPGDVLIFDSWVYHCAGQNISDIDRYGVNHVFTAPFMKQQIDFPKLVKQRNFSPRLKDLMGSEFEVAKDVNAFREKRFRKLNK